MFTKTILLHTAKTIGFGFNSGSITDYGKHTGLDVGCPECKKIPVGPYQLVTKNFMVTKPNWLAFAYALGALALLWILLR